MEMCQLWLKLNARIKEILLLQPVRFVTLVISYQKVTEIIDPFSQELGHVRQNVSGPLNTCRS